MIRSVPALAPNEQSRLKQCEIAIERGLNTFVEVGRALAEIRDAKLYRIEFKTFESYCKERWEIGRSRAYELIDQAKVTEALTAAGLDLSAAADISKRDALALRDDPRAVKEIKARVDAGTPPASAIKTVVAEKKAEKADQHAANARFQEAHQKALAPAIQEYEAAKAAAIATHRQSAQSDLGAADRIAELEQANEFLEQRVAELEAKVKTFERLEPMYRDWIEGGWDRVVQAKDDTIAEIQRTATARISSESHEKVRNLNAMRGLAKKLDEAGLGKNAVLDLETGEFVNG